MWEGCDGAWEDLWKARAKPGAEAHTPGRETCGFTTGLSASASRCVCSLALSDFPGGICLQFGRPGFDPCIGKIPWRRKWQPTPVLLPGKSHGQRILVGYSPWGRKELDTTERLHSHFHFLSPPKVFSLYLIQMEAWFGHLSPSGFTFILLKCPFNHPISPPFGPVLAHLAPTPGNTLTFLSIYIIPCPAKPYLQSSFLHKIFPDTSLFLEHSKL